MMNRRLSIPRENLGSCGISLHTNPIRKEPSNWFARGFPVNEGELAEAVAEVAGNEFVGRGMRPGDVRRQSKKPDLDEG
jgi:hypothetical protein